MYDGDSVKGDSERALISSINASLSRVAIDPRLDIFTKTTRKNYRKIFVEYNNATLSVYESPRI